MTWVPPGHERSDGQIEPSPRDGAAPTCRDRNDCGSRTVRGVRRRRRRRVGADRTVDRDVSLRYRGLDDAGSGPHDRVHGSPHHGCPTGDGDRADECRRVDVGSHIDATLPG
ncbi:MAG: hypothetical protein RI958_2809, partial [Actinomycetota bacterium]